MRIMIVVIVSLFIIGLAGAADWTYSNQSPQIQRLQGVILYPYEIEEVKTEDGIGYKYKLLRLKDNGQAIHQDRGKFAVENRRAIAKQLYDIGDLILNQKGDEIDSKIADFSQPTTKLAVEKAQ